MKKIAAIFLLGLLLFNWYGYRLVVGYWQERAKSELEAKIDVSDYDESQLITVKVPLTHLSYYNSSPVFERVNGSVEIGGTQYKYVKRRLYNGLLEMLCLPDQGSMKLRAATNNFFQMANGLQTVPGKHPGAQSLPVKAVDFDPYLPVDHLALAVPALAPVPVFAYYSLGLSTLFPPADERPPIVV